MIRPDKININEALRYMGCDPASADEVLTEKVKKCADELLKVIRPTYVYKIFDIEETDEGIAVSGTGLVMTGNSIKQHLKGCYAIAAMAVTLSAHADRYIRMAEVSDMAQALIADSLCTAAAEQVCDAAESEIRAALPEGTYMTWRFSPGYGDLPLEIQPHFLRILNTEKLIGLTANESLIMLPRKSVTAIIGLSKGPIEKKRAGCASCSMNKTCPYRKRGVRCEI